MNRKKFEVIAREEADQHTIYVKGELDLAVAAEFRSAIEPLISTDKEVILDMGELTYIDSTGMGILIFFLKARKEENRAFAVQNIPQKIKKLLDLTGITRFLPVQDGAPGQEAGEV
ncbi:STAS domain-containing protein [Gorillibacterium sp. CAU 1737]|uniref:STAS domain-containing protein n=1 Tax=Gorillibacterium sp. CAU 1737 TaxID=3140362 RepID=UPI0032613CBF